MQTLQQLVVNQAQNQPQQQQARERAPRKSEVVDSDLEASLQDEVLEIKVKKKNSQEGGTTIEGGIKNQQMIPRRRSWSLMAKLKVMSCWSGS